MILHLDLVDPQEEEKVQVEYAWRQDYTVG